MKKIQSDWELERKRIPLLVRWMFPKKIEDMISQLVLPAVFFFFVSLPYFYFKEQIMKLRG